ncbi:LCP family protein [Cellulomonas sp. RIT-PI-Y]|uniref:LCP family protein n=1 Tax=Cellulomonas sp. RIT-PI-Y TaxID=3035297 RepID=UPI0021DB1F09|nr:LCP family protein [Cellulomonas sp. RIT-PI-Y]
MAPDAHRRARPRSRRRSTGRRALIISLCVLLGLGAVGVGGLWGIQHWLTSRVEKIDDPFAALPSRPATSATAAPADDADAPMNILLLGSDSRISAGDPSQWEVGAQRTDTIMLVHLPADGEAAYVMSFPRDSWVDIPGHGEGKINAAFSYGGPTLMIQTIEQLTNIRIDHFVIADFESFQQITDAMGGVRITLDQPLTVDGTTIPAGKQQLLTGEQALTWVRERKTLARGDFDRVQRQQAWIRSMVARMRNEGTLSNPAKSVPFLRSVGDAVATDPGLDDQVMSQLQNMAKNLASTDIAFFTVPTDGTGRSPDGTQSIVVLNQEALAALMASVGTDTVDDYLAANADTVDMLPPVVQ